MVMMVLMEKEHGSGWVVLRKEIFFLQTMEIVQMTVGSFLGLEIV